MTPMLVNASYHNYQEYILCGLWEGTLLYSSHPYLGTLVPETMNSTNYIEASLFNIMMHSVSLHDSQEYRKSSKKKNPFSLYD